VSWPMVKLGELFKVTSGGTPSRQKSEYYDGGEIHWVKTGDLHNKYVESASEFITQAGLKGSSTRLYPKGTVLVAMYGATIGACSILNVEACTNQACAAFVPNENVDIDFLYYLLKYCKPDFVKAGSGGAQPNISSTFLKDYKIPLPSLAEQKRIAAILDKADAIRRKRKQAIQLADDFLRSVFLDMFGDPVTNPKGWEVKSLKDVLKSISSGWSANGDSRPCEEGELGVLKISAVTSGRFIPTENKAVQVSDIPSSKKLVFPKKGDMLFSRANTRELVAASCIVVEDSPNTFLPDKLWLVKTDESQLLPEFLNYLLKIPGFKETLTSQATGSSGSMLNISMSKFEQTSCLIPPIELQHRFTNLYWKLQETLSGFEESESTLKESFNALIQKAFSGQL
jgi:type I restriction enzyme S subunit